jgi:NAD(P)-dependent dehydrogenase (short-subunit alcohol dehydrogenase family)
MAGRKQVHDEAAEPKVALVTGGTRGLGKAATERLLADGWQVAICARRPPEAPIVAAGREAWFTPADVRTAEGAQALVDAVVGRFGRLDLLVNNAGGGPAVNVADSSPSLLEKVIALNLMAPLYLSRCAQAVMRDQPTGGAIINIASISGVRPSPGAAAYGAAKAGLINLGKSLAMEWGPKVRVNTVTVGLVDAPEHPEHYGGAESMRQISETLPMRRMARGADVAAAVGYLASPDAAYVSGANLEIHGGGEPPAYLVIQERDRG